MKHKIGIVTINYDIDGNFVSGSFEPSIAVQVPVDEIKKIDSSSVLSIVKDNADIVLSSWFSKLTDIELNKTLKSESVGCYRWPNQNLQTCKFEYYYE